VSARASTHPASVPASSLQLLPLPFHFTSGVSLSDSFVSALGGPVWDGQMVLIWRNG